MNTTRLLSARIAKKADVPPEVILAVVTAILQLLAACRDDQSPSELIRGELAHRPLVFRILVRRMLRQHGRQADTVAVYTAISQQVNESTDDELTLAASECLAAGERDSWEAAR